MNVTKISDNLFYHTPGAGSVALACPHNVRYPDLCTKCQRRHKMNFNEFNGFQTLLLAEVVKMKDTKGKEYANSEDRFANFRRLAIQLDLSDIQVAWIYLSKHLDSIASYCKTGQIFSTEPIRGRIVDALTYLTLIAGMIDEKEKGS